MSRKAEFFSFLSKCNKSLVGSLQIVVAKTNLVDFVTPEFIVLKE